MKELPKWPSAIELDYRKFYDNIDLTILRPILANLGLSPKLTFELTCTLHTDDSHPVWIDRGILQGFPTSPYLSLLHLHLGAPLLNEGNTKFTYIGYADDGLVPCTDPLTTTLTLATIVAPLGLTLKPSGTSIIKHNHNLKSFKFLGLRLHPSGKLTIDSRSGKMTGTEVTLETLPYLYESDLPTGPTPSQTPQINQLKRLARTKLDPTKILNDYLTLREGDQSDKSPTNNPET